MWNPTDEDLKSGGDGWSEELDDLSPRSKSRVIQDLYGEGQALEEEESSNYVEKKVEQLDTILRGMASEDKGAYLAACKQYPEVESNKALRLKFLRAELFDAGLAAHRITQYFDFMRQWFRESLLGKRIALSDLDEFDQQVLSSGAIQALAQKDGSGRRILFFLTSDLQFKSNQNLFRALWYVINATVEEDVVQKQGLVFVIYALRKGDSRASETNKKMMLQLAAFIRFAAPTRVVGLHFVYDLSIQKELARLFGSALSRTLRLRFVTHHAASHQECKNRLAKYGIPEDAIPVGNDGKPELGDHLGWLQQQKSSEGSLLKRMSSSTEEDESQKKRQTTFERRLSPGDATTSQSFLPRAPAESTRLGGLPDTPLSTNPSLSTPWAASLGLENWSSRQEIGAITHHAYRPGMQSFPASGPRSDTTSHSALLALNNMISSQPFPIHDPSMLMGQMAAAGGSHMGSSALQPGQNFISNPNTMMALMSSSFNIDPNFRLGAGSHVAQQSVGLQPAHASMPNPFLNRDMRNDGGLAGVGAATSSSRREAPSRLPSRLPTVLFLESDIGSLSDYQCFLRQQIEVFDASSDDVQYNASRMNRSIVLGQVGLRCRHCATSPEWERASGAVYYPGRLSMLYQAGQNMAKNHLCNGCRKIPQETRDYLNLLRGDKRRATAGKDYWSKTAKLLGIYEDGSNGLKFQPTDG